MADQSELILIKQSLVAIRQRVNEDLDALEAALDRQLPAEQPRREVPANRSARRSFYKDRLANIS